MDPLKTTLLKTCDLFLPKDNKKLTSCGWQAMELNDFLGLRWSPVQEGRLL